MHGAIGGVEQLTENRHLGSYPLLGDLDPDSATSYSSGVSSFRTPVNYRFHTFNVRPSRVASSCGDI